MADSLESRRRRKSSMTELTSLMSDCGGSPSQSFSGKDLGESDSAQLGGKRRRELTKSLSTFLDETLSSRTSASSRRIHHELPPADKFNNAPIRDTRRVSDSMPSVPRRRNSFSSVNSGSDIRDDASLGDHSILAEDDTIIHEPSVVHHQPEPETHHSPQQQENHPDDDSISRLPLDPTASELRFISDYDKLSAPIRVGRVISSVATPSSRNRDNSSGEVTDETIQSIMISQIPEHIRKQMPSDMWKRIFLVDVIQKHSGVASVCSDLSEDVLSVLSRRSTTKMVDHTGLVNSPPREKIDNTFVEENLESHSTFREMDESIASGGDNTHQGMDINSAATASTDRSTSLEIKEEEDESIAVSSSSLSPSNSRLSPRSIGSGKHSSSKSTRHANKRSIHHEWHAASNAARDKKDSPPQVPTKISSRENSARNGGSLEVSGRSSLRGGVPITKRSSSVRFCPETKVRNYERILEVHPSTSSGPSVGIGWKYVEGTSQINWFKSLDGNKRHNDFLLTREAREHIVRVDLGYSPKQISKAVRKNLKLKNQRRRTINNLQEYGSFAPVEKVEYMIEKCQRKLGRLRLGRRSSRTTL